MTTSESFPPSPGQKVPVCRGNGGISGDGGNRTRGVFPPCRVPLKHGETPAYALIDEADRALVEGRKWYLHYSAGRCYAMSASRYGTTRAMHRLILGLADGSQVVDHINGDGLDNRRANIRVVTTAQNAQNQGSRGGSSRFRGVTFDKSRGLWMASAMLHGRRTTIGRFGTEDEAGAAAAAWRAEHMPYSAEAA